MGGLLIKNIGCSMLPCHLSSIKTHLISWVHHARAVAFVASVETSYLHFVIYKVHIKTPL